MTSNREDTLCCPVSHGELVRLSAGVFGVSEVLYCARSHRTYPIADGLPVLLSDEATLLDESEIVAIEAKIAELKL